MSTLHAAGVWVSDGRRMLLAPTTVSVSTGEIVAVHGDPGHRHTLFALALGGRLADARGRSTSTATGPRRPGSGRSRWSTCPE